MRAWLLAFSLGCALVTIAFPRPADACCPAPPSGQPAVNTNQTVVIVWDAATKTEHFVRRATWKSDAADFGFIVPSPTKPELAESGDAAFPLLARVTEPERIKQKRPAASCLACGTLSRSKSAEPESQAVASVTVLEEKTVAGFDAVVLEASSPTALGAWLKDHGYASSPDIEAWAKPYVDQGWKLTAMKVAKGGGGDGGAATAKEIAAAALRMSFKTERPLFPYREPEGMTRAGAAAGQSRLLRIYFVGDARYEGTLTKESAWTGRAVWANRLAPSDRDKLRADLGVGPSTGETWLTELEDWWPYKVAPADLVFEKSASQTTLKRPPIIEYTSNEREEDVALASALVLVAAPFLRRRRRPPT